MVKRVFTALALTVVLLGPEAKAHYYTSSGFFIHSVLCGVNITSLPNPEQHPAKAVCTVVASFVESLCQNPAGQEVFGEAATQLTGVSQEQLDAGNVTDKKKGTGHVDVVISDDFLLARPDLLCVNPNWSVVDTLVRSLRAKVEIFTCTDESCSESSLATRFETDCTLPSQYSLEDNPPPQGTAYVCAEGEFEHVH